MASESEMKNAAAPGAVPEQATDSQLREDASQSAVRASACGIVAVDERGIVRLCNPAAQKLLARPREQLVGSQFGFPISLGQSHEINVVGPDGRARPVEMRTTATTLEGERLYVVALHDAIRRKEAEQDLDVAMAVAAHELASPLAGIKMLVHLMRDDRAAATEEQRTQIIDRIADRLDHAEALVSKLRTASRIDAHTTKTTREPVPVLDVLLERLSEVSDRAQQVYLWCDPELVGLVDRTAFVEMFTNYLENAFAYGEPPFEIRVAEQAGSIVVRVCDHGPGVPESFIPHLFERFRRDPQAEKTTEGSGLGLWIVRSLAQANGGDAWYEPHSDEGACFCLRLQAAHGRRS